MKQRPPALKKYMDHDVGGDEGPEYCIVRLYTGPRGELYFLVFTREHRYEGDALVGKRVVYSGDIRRNAIPLNAVDPDALYLALKKAATYQERVKVYRDREYFGSRGRELIHHMEIPEELAKRARVEQNLQLFGRVLRERLRRVWDGMIRRSKRTSKSYFRKRHVQQTRLWM